MTITSFVKLEIYLLFNRMQRTYFLGQRTSNQLINIAIDPIENIPKKVIVCDVNVECVRIGFESIEIFPLGESVVHVGRRCILSVLSNFWTYIWYIFPSVRCVFLSFWHYRIFLFKPNTYAVHRPSIYEYKLLEIDSLVHVHSGL